MSRAPDTPRTADIRRARRSADLTTDRRNGDRLLIGVHPVRLRQADSPVCYSVTIELPPSHEGAPDPLVLSECNQSLRPRRRGRLVDVTDGHCSCSLVRDEGKDDEQLTAKYRKKGWSPAKIERALADRRSARAKRGDVGPELLENWLAELARRYRSVAVFVHWSSTPLDPDASHPSIRTEDLGDGPLPREAWFDVESTA